MTQLVVNQLENNDSVKFNIRMNKSKSLYAVRLKMIKHGVISDGDFKLEILDGADVLAESTLNASDFSALGDYAYGYFKFNLPCPVRVNASTSTGYTEITFRVSVSNHTDSDDNYIGLIKQHEYKYITEYGGYPAQATTDEGKAWYAPYGVELYTYSNI